MALRDEMKKHIGKYVTVWGKDSYRSGTLIYFGDYIALQNINVINYIFLKNVEEIVVDMGDE